MKSRRAVASPPFYRGINRRMKLRNPVFAVVIAIVFLLSIVLYLYNFYWSANSYQAKQTVREFYTYEQSGDYGSAWELMHPTMKERFAKDRYIQSRAAAYMQQLGAQTFHFELSDPKHMERWSMTQESVPLTDVYRVQVEQRLMTVFGEWVIRQNVYAVKEEGKWKLLWEYKNTG